MHPYSLILPNLAPISFQFNSNSNLQCGEGRFSQRHEEESIACAMDVPRGTVLVAPGSITDLKVNTAAAAR